MTFPRRAGFASAAFFLCLLAAPAGALSLGLDPDPGWRQTQTPAALAEVLDRWLDTHTPYPRKPDPPRIRVIGRAEAAALQGSAARTGQITRALYDPETQTIYLIAPWTGKTAVEASELLHELVHHRQHGARHWICPAAQEPEAYDLQAAWLAERGQTAKINRFAAVWDAGCNRRDKHPD